MPDNQLVATFTDAGGSQDATGYAATISWRQQTDTGQVTYDGGAGQFDVWDEDIHAYKDTANLST